MTTELKKYNAIISKTVFMVLITSLIGITVMAGILYKIVRKICNFTYKYNKTII